ncbi:hypothetical protein MASR2M50_04190 [Thauera sp.]|jgi:hypothetical protein
MRRAATAYRPHGQPPPVRPAGGHLRPAAVLPGADTAEARPFPARSLLGAGLGARLVLVAGALALLWTTVLWALK